MIVPRHLLLPLALMVLSAAITGGSFTLNRLAADAGVPPTAYAFWQSIGGALLLLALVIASGDRLRLSRAHLVGYIVTGSLALGIPCALFTFVAPRIPAGALTLVLALTPAATYALGMLLRLERFRWLGLIGLAIGFSGVAVIVRSDDALGGSGAWAWYLLALIGPILYGGSNVAGVLLRPPAASALSMGCGILFGSAIVLAPLMLATGQAWTPIGVQLRALEPILVAATVDAIGYSIFFVIVRITGPTFFSQVNYLAVLAGIGWSMLILGERPALGLFLAMLLMFIGVFVMGYGQGREADAAVARAARRPSVTDSPGLLE
jgi:drug/metabolite transporter (DMT)-like permease